MVIAINQYFGNVYNIYDYIKQFIYKIKTYAKEEIYMRCQNCGTDNAAGARFCKGCGAEITGNSSNPPVPPKLPEHPSAGDYDYTPITMWGYLGYQLLFSIPCIGQILIMVFAFGGTRNINLRNFSRSFFLFWVISQIVTVVITMLVMKSVMDSLGFSNFRF